MAATSDSDSPHPGSDSPHSVAATSSELSTHGCLGEGWWGDLGEGWWERDFSPYLAKSVLRCSAARHAVAGHIRSSSSVDIVFGMETSLELLVIGDDGVVESVSEQSVFGIIKDLAILKWNEEYRESMAEIDGRDLLVVISDSRKLSFLGFCSKRQRFVAVNHVQLSVPGDQRHQLGRMLAVDPTGCFVTVSAYEGRFTLLPVSKSAGNDIVNEKIIYPPEEEISFPELILKPYTSYKDDRRIDSDEEITDNSSSEDKPDEEITDNSSSEDEPDVRSTIWRMCFFPNENKEGRNPVLAVLMNMKTTGENQIVLHECNLSTQSVHVISRYSEAGPLSYHISAVPNLSGFALCFRIGDVLLMDIRNLHNIYSIHKINLDISSVIEEQISFDDPCRVPFVDVDGMSNVACALLELRDSGGVDPLDTDCESGKSISASMYVVSWSWEPVESTSSKLIFCLDTGELHILEICSGIGGFRVNLSDCVGKGLPCKTLLWVEGGFIAGLTDMGDGVVLKLESGKIDYRSPIHLAPILDLSVEKCIGEKPDQMFAGCGMTPEGSIRIIRNGINVEKLVRTAAIYQGITGTWTMRMNKSDAYHSFLVLSFLEATRVLRVGVSFTDVTDAAGFLPDACTLACGLVSDGLLVQIHTAGVRICLPTIDGHPQGIPLSTPICTSWHPDKMSIGFGAVGHNFLVVSTYIPFFFIYSGC